MSHVTEQMHTSSGQIAISRDRYNMMRFSVIALGLALIGGVLFLLFKQPKVVLPLPLPDVWLEGDLGITVPVEVVEKLKNVHGVDAVVYISNKGQIHVTGPDGRPRDVCADVRGTEIVERPGKSCGQKETPEYFLQVLYYGYNPGCTSGGGKLAC